MEHSQNSPTKSNRNLRILVVGAGIAGLTLAGLLKKQGFSPVVIERQTEEVFNKTGYMIGLMPLGGQVLNMLDLQQEYLDNSLAIEGYSMYGTNGKRLNHFGMEAISEFGTYQGISRPMLIDLLLRRCDTPRYGVTVTTIEKKNKVSLVTFSDGTTEEFDLVVIADGIHSVTRDIVFGEKNRTYRQTGWGGWAWFTDELPPELGPNYHEYWGPNVFMGLYPVEGNRVGVFLGGAMKDIKKAGHKRIAEKAEKIPSELDLKKMLLPLEENPDLFFWDFHDCRSERLIDGNVVLIGDAADGFLPTAGIGASMAMDSASALADELLRCDPDQLDYALTLYEKRQHERVISAQNTSRTLGNIMFVKNPVLSWLRNQSLRFVTVNSFLKGVRELIEKR